MNTSIFNQSAEQSLFAPRFNVPASVALMQALLSPRSAILLRSLFALRPALLLRASAH